jgi:hypothetical protein
MPPFPVPVLAGSLVSCPGCWCAVPRPDLARHAAVCPGRLAEDDGGQADPGSGAQLRAQLPHLGEQPVIALPELAHVGPGRPQVFPGLMQVADQ